MSTAVSGATAPSPIALASPMPEHDTETPTPEQLQILREWDQGLYRIVIEGGTDADRALVAARAREALTPLPAPGSSHAIRNALQVLESSAMPLRDVVQGSVTAFDDESLAAIKRLLMTAIERDAARDALAAGITLEDSVSVQQLVDEFDENPHRFAVRFMNAVEYIRQLTRRVEKLEECALVSFPQQMGATRS